MGGLGAKVRGGAGGESTAGAGGCGSVTANASTAAPAARLLSAAGRNRAGRSMAGATAEQTSSFGAVASAASARLSRTVWIAAATQALAAVRAAASALRPSTVCTAAATQAHAAARASTSVAVDFGRCGMASSAAAKRPSSTAPANTCCILAFSVWLLASNASDKRPSRAATPSTCCIFNFSAWLLASWSKRTNDPSSDALSSKTRARSLAPSKVVSSRSCWRGAPCVTWCLNASSMRCLILSVSSRPGSERSSFGAAWSTWFMASNTTNFPAIRSSPCGSDCST
mmetsp:Transcript_61686/g.143516  ORF Transcript_61686/g.143516 Transcript_61686/m.143516 type:complete len:285 (+) Transcript_61686:303-1157(+)